MSKIIFFALLCLCQTEQITSFQFGPVPFSYRLTCLKQLTCKYIGWACNDCNTLIKCNSNSTFDVSCPEKYPDRPFCDPNLARCVRDSKGCEKIIIDDLKCPDKGIYPDVTSCKRYISCPSKDAIGTTYTCMFGNIFDASLNRCVNNLICYTPSKECDGLNITFAYKYNPNLYVVCHNNRRPVLKSCGASNMFFSNETESCEFACIKEGVFAHLNNNKLFYVCKYNNEFELTQSIDTCEEGTIFDASLNDCIANNIEDSFNNATNYANNFTTSFVTETLSTTTQNIVTDNSSDPESESMPSTTTGKYTTNNIVLSTTTQIFQSSIFTDNTSKNDISKSTDASTITINKSDQITDKVDEEDSDNSEDSSSESTSEEENKSEKNRRDKSLKSSKSSKSDQDKDKGRKNTSDESSASSQD